MDHSAVSRIYIVDRNSTTSVYELGGVLVLVAADLKISQDSRSYFEIPP